MKHWSVSNIQKVEIRKEQTLFHITLFWGSWVSVVSICQHGLRKDCSEPVKDVWCTLEAKPGLCGPRGFWATVPSTTEDNLLLVFKEIFHNTNCTGSCDIWDYTVRTSLGPMLPGGHVLYMMKCDCKYWELWINTVVITHSVSSQSWKTSSSALTRHSLQSRRTNSSGSTRGSRFSLKRNVINNNEATMPDIFLNLILFKLSNLLSDCKSIP